MDHQEKDGGGSEKPFLWNCLEKYQKLGETPPNFLSYDWLGVRDESVGEDVKWHLDTLSAEIALFKEMLECEEDSKFVKLMLARLFSAHNSIKPGEDSYFEETLKWQERLR
ncbi:rab geranylgeranyl transferase like protein [Carex littledalei]|uniref:Rab geranylgeranyl transferase like protein n=1 Tax=Carex littledalei TaxID=544730 RepID=A0A833QGM2_9POAL|nr:rab geranylgeranyl transferase like protein [Carex littledalei]